MLLYKRYIEDIWMTQDKKASGKIALRLPISLHMKLIESAKKEGISLNAFLVSLVTESVVRKELE
jgi:predicted HicB family RNase H-like nuclease